MCLGNGDFSGYLLLIGFSGLIIYKIFKIAKKTKINTYLELTETMVGKHRFLNDVINNMLNVFLFISYIVMVAGVGAFFHQEFGIPTIYGAIGVTICNIIVLKGDIDKITKINFILIPFLVITIIALGFKEGKISVSGYENFMKNGWILKAILYASYNMITLIPIILKFSDKINNKSKMIVASILTFAIMSIMSISIFCVITNNFETVLNTEMPMVYIVNNLGTIYKIIYSIVVLIAIFTTAISSGYSFINNIAKNKKQYKIFLYVISILGIALSPLGFGNLLDFLYPMLGFLGLVQIFFILKA